MASSARWQAVICVACYAWTSVPTPLEMADLYQYYMPIPDIGRLGSFNTADLKGRSLVIADSSKFCKLSSPWNMHRWHFESDGRELTVSKMAVSFSVPQRYCSLWGHSKSSHGALATCIHPAQSWLIFTQDENVLMFSQKILIKTVMWHYQKTDTIWDEDRSSIWTTDRTTQRKPRSFLGFCNVLSRFPRLLNMGSAVKEEGTRKQMRFICWSLYGQENAVENREKLLVSPPILALHLQRTSIQSIPTRATPK